MKLSKLLGNLLLLAVLSSCSTYQTSDWKAWITLPASEDCMGFSVMSGREVRYPAEHPVCKEKKLKSVWIDYESYKMLRRDIQINCQLNQCKQITGAFDSMFLVIDQALQKIPK